MKFTDILFSFKGRINRGTFWAFCLLTIPIWGGGWLLDVSINGERGIFYWLGVLVCFWPSLALNIKRCHDRNRSGWFYLLAFIPFINIWYIVEIGFLPGTDGLNRFDKLADTQSEISENPERV